MTTHRIKARVQKKFEGVAHKLSPSEEQTRLDCAHVGSAYELAKKARLIGCMRSAPKDLSTNRRHFEGFGDGGNGDQRWPLLTAWPKRAQPGDGGFRVRCGARPYLGSKSSPGKEADDDAQKCGYEKCPHPGVQKVLKRGLVV